MTTTLHDEAEERLLDAMLAEALAAKAAARPAHPRRHLAAAAVMLLAIGVAIGVAFLAPSRAHLAQDPEPLAPPANATVGGGAALAELLRTTPGTATMFCRITPADLPLLGKFVQLEALVIEPLDVHDKSDAEAWTLEPLRSLRALRHLTIGILPRLRPTELRHLAALPRLSQLYLTGTTHLLDRELADELGKLPIRRMKLSAVRCAPDGFAGLCEHPLLADLELWNCLHLHRCDLTRLQNLRALQRLALIGFGGRMADAFERTSPLPGEDPVAPPEPAPGPDRTGLYGRAFLHATPRILAAIAKAPKLEHLDLRGSVVDGATLAALPPKLRALGLRQVTVLGDDAFDQVRLEHVTDLAVSVPEPMDDDTGARVRLDPRTQERREQAACELIQRLQPTTLRLEGCISDPLADVLAKATNVRELEFTHLGNQDQPRTDAIARMTGLQILRWHHVHAGTDPTPLRDLPQLREIHLYHADPAVAEAFRTTLGARVAITVHDS